MCSLLRGETSTDIYDRKYFVDVSPIQGRHRYEPLYPLVEEMYLSVCWKDLLTYVHENERDLLDVSANPSVDQVSRGRHFELIVIQRCRRAPFTIPGDSQLLFLITLPSLWEIMWCHTTSLGRAAWSFLLI